MQDDVAGLFQVRTVGLVYAVTQVGEGRAHEFALVVEGVDAPAGVLLQHRGVEQVAPAIGRVFFKVGVAGPVGDAGGAPLVGDAVAVVGVEGGIVESGVDVGPVAEVACVDLGQQTQF